MKDCEDYGYKVLKIYGNEAEINHILKEIRLLKLKTEELEDGMPKNILELNMPDFDSFICFDLEMSGSLGIKKGDKPSEIIEIGVVKVVNGEIVDKKDWLCNPGRNIIPRVKRLTHITDEMVKDAPPVAVAVKEFVDYVGNFPIVGHNIKDADLYYLRQAAKKAGIQLEVSYFDTYRFAFNNKEQLCLDSLKLGDLAKIFDIPANNVHRAWCDAEITALLYFKLKGLSCQK